MRKSLIRNDIFSNDTSTGSFLQRKMSGSERKHPLYPPRLLALPIASESFDLVTCRFAAHHFTDLPKAMSEMARLAKPGGHVAAIDMEGDDDPALDALNHEIEIFHDPTHVRSYTARHWRELFVASGFEITACETRLREMPGGLTVSRWCELGNSGAEALQAIRNRLAAASPESLAALDITRAADGEFRIPVRTLLIIGRKLPKS